jgi:hypothetical protein
MSEETGSGSMGPSRPPPSQPPISGTAGPERVSIPSIGVDAKLVPVGLKPDGSMQVPQFGLAAWYDRGPRPGEVGPAVIVAPVDSKKGPDVIYRLKELEPGDQVAVTYPGGLQATFSVDGREQIPKSELPVDRIWGSTPGPTLRLITCGGDFDRASGHYRSNVIVYASLMGVY